MNALSPAPVRVGVLGCGNVGGALLRLLADDADAIAARTGVHLHVVRVAVRDVARQRPVELPPDLLTDDAEAVVSAPDVDVVVEVIGGVEPARSLVLAALKAGKPVVTANKELLANVGAELFEAAAEAGVDLLYEASVAGGIPLIRPLRESLAGERITRVMGIVNGTTNYILTKMTEEGASYADALAEAQTLGYAERDPTADVEGYDAGAKAAILATIAFGVKVVAADVHREGITAVTAADIAFARRLGYVVKLLAVVERIQPAGPTSHGPGRGWGPRLGEEAGVGAPAGPTSHGPGRGWGPRLGEEAGVGAPAGETGHGPGRGWGPRLGEEAGVGAPAGETGRVAARVHPAMVPVTHPLASVRHSFNAVFIEGEAVGELMLYGPGAGGKPTASAVLGDLIDAAHNLSIGGSGRTGTLAPTRFRPMEELDSQYYLNMHVADRPGVLAAVAAVFGDHGVSIRSMEQEGLGEEARLVFITHLARERDVQATLSDLRHLDVVRRVGGLLRVIGPE